MEFFRSLINNAFWQGFLAGILFVVVVSQLRAFIPWLIKTIRKRIHLARERAIAGIGARLRTDVYHWAQDQHLAAVFFPLDEILIPPRILAPPAFSATEEVGEYITTDIISQAVPYMPDWPEMAALYGAPTLSLPEALEKEANLLLLGQPGSGKTVALANLATVLSRRDLAAGKMGGYIPVPIHIVDLLPKLTQPKPPTIIEALCSGVSTYASKLTMAQLPGFLKNSLPGGKLILLIDGFDEADPEAQKIVKEFLQSIIEAFPNIRMVVTAIPGNYISLNQIGLIPVALAAWSENDRNHFLNLWHEKWLYYGKQSETASPEKLESLLFQNWLANREVSSTPLELTLKVWGALEGDSLGPGIPSLMESHIRRLTVDINDSFEVLERLAVQMISNLQPVASLRDARRWISKFEQLAAPEKPKRRLFAKKSPTDLSDPVSESLYRLMDRGVLVQHGGNSLRMLHSTFTFYLASRGFSKSGLLNILLDQSDWYGKFSTLAFVSDLSDLTSAVQSIVGSDQEPTHLKSLQVGRWLRFSSKYSAWRALVLRYLVELVQKEAPTLGISGRIISALAFSGDPGVSTLFRQFIKSSQTNLRLLGALGSGLIFDTKAVNELSGLFIDNDPIIGGAACLALVNINSRSSLDVVMSLLIHGSEALRRAAAEALANHPAEGHAVLQEGSSLTDLLVRRSVIYGLIRVNQPWAIQLLEKMQIEDGQWVVRNAASQALDDIRQSNQTIPQPIPELTEMPWLVEFAAKRGMGVTPGDPAIELLVRALETGDPRERISALEYFRLSGIGSYMPQLYQAYYGSQAILRETAFNTLWHFSAAGVELPPAIQFGLS